MNNFRSVSLNRFFSFFSFFSANIFFFAILKLKWNSDNSLPYQYIDWKSFSSMPKNCGSHATRAEINVIFIHAQCRRVLADVWHLKSAIFRRVFVHQMCVPAQRWIKSMGKERHNLRIRCVFVYACGCLYRLCIKWHFAIAIFISPIFWHSNDWKIHFFALDPAKPHSHWAACTTLMHEQHFSRFSCVFVVVGTFYCHRDKAIAHKSCACILVCFQYSHRQTKFDRKTV